MKFHPKYLVISTALIVIAVAYGQQSIDAERRVSHLQQALEQLMRSPRSTEQALPAQDKLLEKIVEEVIFLHRENSALKKEIEMLKSKL